jgi:hypothetical protein
MLDVVTAVLLIAVPVTFNVAFFALGRSFDYPDILRKEPDEILRRFHAGGAGLILRWEALLLSALGMLPLAILLPVVLEGPASWSFLSMALGIGAALVQAIGLARWPFAVPELARRYVAADAPELDPVEAAATRRSIDITFVTIHRLLGVGIGEHLGYLLTGCWTLTATALIVTTAVIPTWLGWLGVPIGVGILAGALEFVGPNEPDGWPLAGTIVPIAYVAWSIWLIALGVAILL